MRFHGWQIEERDTVSTTQEAIRPLLRDAAQPRVVLVSREQEAGRGRRGRDWASPRGGLWCSIALHRTLPVDPFHGLLLAAATRDSIADHVRGDDRLRLKWPNDLVTAAPAERKWGGILADVVTTTANSAWVVFGLGVNLDLSLKQLPQTGPEALPATSIRVEFGETPSPETALLAILTRFDQLLDADSKSRARSLEILRRIVGTLGREVTWTEAVSWDEPSSADQRSGDSPDLGSRSVGRRSQRGRAVDLESDGALLVEGPSGERVVLRSGEVQHLRATGGQ